MKNLSLFVSAFALCASTSYAAINCGTLPSCASLGYTDTVANCPSSSEVLKCPFDTTMGKCTRGPSIGDLKYSLRGDDHDGWLKCDGRVFSSDSTAKYYKLFQIIGTNFCHRYSSKDDTSYTTSHCSSGMFAVPDYRGFFLRGMPTQRLANAAGITATSKYYSDAAGFMTGNMDSYTIYAPKKEQLPNATLSQWVGWTGAYGNGFPDGSNDSSSGTGGWRDFPRQSQSVTVNLTLSDGNSIYTTGGHVIPAHYAANIFIYAGR